MRSRDVGQSLHPGRGVFWGAPRLPELPLWRHSHPPALSLPVTLTQPHPTPRGQERLQDQRHLHVSEAVLSLNRGEGDNGPNYNCWVDQKLQYHFSATRIPNILYVLLSDTSLHALPLFTIPILLKGFSTWSFCPVWHGTLPYKNVYLFGTFSTTDTWHYVSHEEAAALLLEEIGQSSLCWTVTFQGPHCGLRLLDWIQCDSNGQILTWRGIVEIWTPLKGFHMLTMECLWIMEWYIISAYCNQAQAY